jgi:hypothetical protein
VIGNAAIVFDNLVWWGFWIGFLPNYLTVLHITLYFIAHHLYFIAHHPISYCTSPCILLHITCILLRITLYVIAHHSVSYCTSPCILLHITLYLIAHHLYFIAHYPVFIAHHPVSYCTISVTKQINTLYWEVTVDCLQYEWLKHVECKL